MIAEFLRNRGDELKNHPRFDPTIQEAKKLSRTYKDLKKQINRYTNQLNEIMGEYFPEFLGDYFPDLTTKTALRFLNEYSSLEEIRELNVENLTKFLKDKSGGHFGEELASRLIETASRFIF